LSLGFGRESFSNGATIEGSITDCNPCREFSNSLMLRLSAPIDAQRIQGGYSGAPVFNQTTGQIIGIIAAADQDQGGLAVPLSTVLEKCPQLASWVYRIIDTVPVPLDSPFYVERLGLGHKSSSVECLCYDTILNDRALIRIKAPSKMGKTSLIARAKDHATKRDCKFVYISLDSIGEDIISNRYKLSRRLCEVVAKELKLELDTLPRESSGDFKTCSDYFERYVLKELKDSEKPTPIVLALDDFDKIFSYPEIAKDLCGQLLAWNQQDDDRWQLLRLLVAYSTDEIHVPGIHVSPLDGKGTGISLPELNLEQVRVLALRYGLAWQTNKSAQRLMRLVGGHPYLIRKALYHITRGVKLDRIIHRPFAEEHDEIYGSHLRHLSQSLKNIELSDVYLKVVNSSEPMWLNREQHYQLYRMGLIKGSSDQVEPRCDLYREYFGSPVF
jgi:hypothetical protein